MIGLRTTAAVIGLGAAAAATVPYSAESPFIARWHWNAAKSIPPPGEPAPKDVVSEISRARGTCVSWSVTIVTPDDQRHVVKFEASPAGNAQHGIDTTASARIVDATLRATFNGPAGRSDTQTYTVSADRKQMTCKGVVSDGRGRSVSYDDVYGRMTEAVAMFRNHRSTAPLMRLVAVALVLSACSEPVAYASGGYPAYGYPYGWSGDWRSWTDGWGRWDHDHDWHDFDHGGWGHGFAHGHRGLGHGGVAGHGGFAGHEGGHAGGFGGHGGGGGGHGR